MSLTITILSLKTTDQPGMNHATVSITDGVEMYVIGVGNVPTEKAQSDVDSRADTIWRVAQIKGVTGDEAARRIEEESSRQTIRDMYLQVVNDFTNALASWDTLTAVQQRAVLKRCVQVNLFLLRFIRREFDY